MKVLIIGGSGIISTSVLDRCINNGFEITVLNRGKREKQKRKEVKYITADVRNDSLSSIIEKIGGEQYDSVIDFLSYELNQLQRTVKLAKCSQFVFISTSCVYDENASHIYTETCNKGNVQWKYSRNKYECELALPSLAHQFGFRYTIVRPYVTYSANRFPYQFSPLEYYTIIYRIQHNLPLPIVDKENRTTVTNSRDFATGLVGLIGNTDAYDNDYHITTDVTVRWSDISDLIAAKMGFSCNYVNIDKGFLKTFKHSIIDIPEIIYDKSREMIFDNKKIKTVVPSFSADITMNSSIDEIIEHFNNNTNKKFNYIWTGCLDRLIFEFSDIKVPFESYCFGSKKDRLMYRIGRSGFLSSIYNSARLIKGRIQRKK